MATQSKPGDDEAHDDAGEAGQSQLTGHPPTGEDGRAAHVSTVYRLGAVKGQPGGTLPDTSVSFVPRGSR